MCEEIKKILRRSEAVCFDVDSTVIQEEGIDELAKFCNKGEEVSALTARAMGGSMTFREALKQRLDIIQPTMTQIREFLKTRPPTLTPGVRKLIGLLQERGIAVYLISGGFKSIIAPIAAQLAIPNQNIYANRLKFYYTGDYAGFDENEPTSQSGGKGKVINLLKEKFHYENVVLIGDGITDAEASPPADAFIGYGGNVIRAAVQSRAKWYVTDFNEIINVLNQ